MTDNFSGATLDPTGLIQEYTDYLDDTMVEGPVLDKMKALAQKGAIAVGKGMDKAGEKVAGGIAKAGAAVKGAGKQLGNKITKEKLMKTWNKMGKPTDMGSIANILSDAGLSDEQKKILSNKVKEIKKAEWDIEVPGYKVGQKEWLKSQVSRAFLPKYFPGYKKYLWIDADAWVNSWYAIDLYLRGCENKKLAIATSADRSYGRVLRAEWVIGSFARIKSQNYKHAKSSGFSEKISREVALKPHLNIGLFSLEENAPHWEVWQKNLKKALSSGKIWGSEQIAMNITICLLYTSPSPRDS